MGWQRQQRYSASIPQRPVPATKDSDSETNIHDTTNAATGGPMDTHGIDLSSLSGSAHYDADPLIRGQETHNDLAHHHDQRQDASAALLHNAQEPGYDGYGFAGAQQQQQQYQQQQHAYHQQQMPPQPPPYVAANYLGPPNEPVRSFRMRKPTCGFWHSSWNMYLWLVVGICFAVGHHAFYASLDGHPADDQVRMLRYGTILAFMAKASLGAAVISAFQQRIWATVRSRILSIAALDSMFAATENLIAFLNWEFLKGAKATAALALFVW